MLSMRLKDLTHLKHYFTSPEARASQGTQVKVLEMQHYDALASTYCGFTFWWERYFLLGFLRELLGGEKLDVLDVGTGPGVVAMLLAGLGHRVVGIDISERMVRRAEEEAGRLNLSGVGFCAGDAEELPFRSNSFDAVISRYLMALLPDPERALAEQGRVLRPGGRVIIIDSAPRPATLRKRAWRLVSLLLTALLERRNPRPLLKIYRHLPLRRRRRPEADVELLAKLGLRVVDVRRIDIPWWNSLSSYLKYGWFQGQAFVVIAVKPG